MEGIQLFQVILMAGSISKIGLSSQYSLIVEAINKGDTKCVILLPPFFSINCKHARDVVVLDAENSSSTETSAEVKVVDALSSLPKIMTGTSNTYGQNFFNQITLELAKALGADYAFVGRVTVDFFSVTTLSLCDHENLLGTS